MKRIDQANWQELLRPEDLFLSDEYRKISSSAGEQLNQLTQETPIWAVWRMSEATEAADKYLRIDRILERNSGNDSPITVPLPALTVSPRAAANTHLIAFPSTSERDFDLALEALEKLASDQGAATVALPYVPAGELQLRAAMERRGYCSLPADDAFTLDINFASFDDYLSGLPRKRSQTIARERRRIQEAGVEVRSITFDQADIDLLARLECNLQAKYGRSRSHSAVQTAMTTLGESLRENVVVFVAELEGDVIGFAFYVFWNGCGYPRWVGFDYEAQGTLPVYFELLFYRGIEESIARGADRIEYSIGSDSTKLSRGCRAIHQTSFWKVLDDA